MKSQVLGVINLAVVTALMFPQTSPAGAIKFHCELQSCECKVVNDSLADSPAT